MLTLEGTLEGTLQALAATSSPRAVLARAGAPQSLHGAPAGDEQPLGHRLLPAGTLRRRKAPPVQLGARVDRGVLAAPRHFLSLGTGRSSRFWAVERRGKFLGVRLS